MRELRPTDLVVELLRTLDEALVDFAPMAGSGGVLLMPSTYSQASYPELERVLRLMRDGPDRRLWWHVNQRYLSGYLNWLRLPFADTQRGKVPRLPGFTEERIQGETERVSGSDGSSVWLMWVKCYVWNQDVDPKLVDEGVEYLVGTMYEGDTSKLTLPIPFLRRALGLPPKDERATRMATLE